jgi:hypothetical protein
VYLVNEVWNPRHHVSVSPIVTEFLQCVLSIELGKRDRGRNPSTSLAPIRPSDLNYFAALVLRVRVAAFFRWAEPTAS